MKQKSVKGRILSYRIEKVTIYKKREKHKLILTVTAKRKNWEISEIFFSKNNEEVCQGLWINLLDDDTLPKNSTLYEFLEYFNVEMIDELVNRPVKLKSNADGYLAIDCTIPL
jgi:hypothetical protein